MIYQDILSNPDQWSFAVQSLGPRAEVSPLRGRQFVDDEEQITFASQVKNIRALMGNAKVFPAFQKAGPRAKFFHRPAHTRAGIVTCGGLSPASTTCRAMVLKCFSKTTRSPRSSALATAIEGLVAT